MDDQPYIAKDHHTPTTNPQAPPDAIALSNLSPPCQSTMRRVHRSRASYTLTPSQHAR
jgi:hypothetical protein